MKVGGKQAHLEPVIKTHRHTHREKDNTLARKPTGSHYAGGSTVTHIYTLHFVLKSPCER